MAGGLDHFDPQEAYRVDLMEDAREGAIDREVALSYLRNAQAFEHMTPAEFERCFPAILDAVNHLDQPPRTAISMISARLNRHGAGVSGVFRETLARRDAANFADGLVFYRSRGQGRPLRTEYGEGKAGYE